MSRERLKKYFAMLKYQIDTLDRYQIREIKPRMGQEVWAGKTQIKYTQANE